MNLREKNSADEISLAEVSKSIKGRVVLENVSVCLERGGVYGFSGSNGSGKTMLFRAIAGLVRIDGGSIVVFGRHIGHDGSFPESLGIVIETTGLWDDCTGVENLRMLAAIRGKVGEGEVVRAIERVGLDPKDGRTFKKYSLGMRQRLCIAQAIMESPELLLLDEPMNALDEDGRQLVCDIIEQERRRGATVLIASHDWVGMEDLCDRRFVMCDGRLREG